MDNTATFDGMFAPMDEHDAGILDALKVAQKHLETLAERGKEELVREAHIREELEAVHEQLEGLNETVCPKKKRGFMGWVKTCCGAVADGASELMGRLGRILLKAGESPAYWLILMLLNLSIGQYAMAVFCLVCCLLFCGD